MRRLGLLVLAAILVAATVVAAERDTPLGVGAKAPEFTVTDQDGRTVRLSELLAQPQYVVLAFYVKAFTPG